MAKELKIRITGDASGLEAAASDAEGTLKGLGSKLSAWSVAGGTMLAQGLSSGLGLLGGLLQQGISTALENEVSSDKLAAKLGIFDPKEQERLGRVAGSLYANAYGESMAEVNEAIGQVFMDGLLPEGATEAQIESITAKVMDVATAFDQDLGSVTMGVSNMLRNELAPSAEDALDIVTRGFQMGADKSDDFMDTLNEYSVQFKKLGIDGATATGLLVQGLQAGARDGDKVADAFKEFSIRAIDGSVATKEAFAALDLPATYDEYADAIAQGGETARSVTEEVLDALKAIPDPSDRAAIAVGLFGTQAEDLGDALYALDLDTAAQGLGQIAGAAEATGAILADNTATKIEMFKRKALQGISEFAAKYVIPALEDMIPHLQRFGDWLGKVADLFKSGGFEAAAGEVFGRLGEAFIQFEVWVYGTAYPAIGRALVGLGKMFGSWVADTAVPYLLENVPIWLDALGNWITGTALPWLGTNTLEFAKKLGGWVVDAATYLAENLPGWIIAFEVWYYGTAIPWVAEKVWAFVEWMADWTEDAAIRLKEKLPIWVREFTAWVVGTAIPAMVEAAIEFRAKMSDWVDEAAAYLAENLPIWVNNFKAWAINSALPAMAQFGRDVLAKINEGVAGAADLLWDVGVAIIQGLIDGAMSLGPKLRSSLTGLVTDNVPGPVKDVLGISSPSKVFYGIGADTTAGLVGGMLSGAGDVAMAAGRLADAAQFQPSRYSAAELSGGSKFVPQQRQVMFVDGREVHVALRPAARNVERSLR